MHFLAIRAPRRGDYSRFLGPNFAKKAFLRAVAAFAAVFCKLLLVDNLSMELNATHVIYGHTRDIFIYGLHGMC
jgi:hypothetical protein